jgi:hypothetical protein
MCQFGENVADGKDFPTDEKEGKKAVIKESVGLKKSWS